MKTTKPSVCLLSFCIIIVFSALPATVSAVCDNQPDAPDCACFNDTPGSWDAGGASATLPIQDVAADTVGTVESCHTAPPVDDDCGKPYYQLTLGMNTEAGALTASYILSVAATPTYTHRQEWCSESVSYWHREAGIPYTLGYRNAWHEDWRNYSVPQMRTWYEREEDDGGRGRWIESGEVDYGTAELGVTIPTPGAYMAISCLHPNPTQSWCDPAVIDRNHSLMVDEIWIHKDGHGDVFKVEATFYEGNSGRQVKHSRHLDDIFSHTTRGSQWLDHSNGVDGVVDTADDWGVKIYGFGIALDSLGDPIYDASRVHYVEHPYMRKVLARARPVTDIPWNNFYVSIKDKLAAYTKTLNAAGGPSITCSASAVKTERTPNGVGEKWYFPSSLQGEEVVVEFDFLKNNPLLIHGLKLFWGAEFIPLGYKVYFGLDKEHYTEAPIADLSGLKTQVGMTPIPVSAVLPKAQKEVRFVKIVFPKGTFSSDAQLTEMIVDYSHGPSEDTSDVPEGVPFFVDVLPGECPNLIMHDADENVLIAVLGSENLSADAIDVKTVKLNGVKVKIQSVSYQDLTTPFIGTDPDCHAEGGDGIVDLVINYKAADVVNAFGPNLRRNTPTPILVSGLLTSQYGGKPFLGQDFITIQGHFWPMFLPAIQKKKK